MSNSYYESRAHRLREDYHAIFGGDELLPEFVLTLLDDAHTHAAATASGTPLLASYDRPGLCRWCLSTVARDLC